MRETQKRMVLMDCKIMLKKFGDIPFDLSYDKMKKELWIIGNKYGISGSDVFKILMENFPHKEINEKK